MLLVAFAGLQYESKLPRMVQQSHNIPRSSKITCVNSRHTSVEAVAPEIKADNIGGFGERPHERQLLPVKIQGFRQQLIRIMLLIEMRKLQRSQA